MIKKKNILNEKYMRMCFKLAQKGLGKVSPNPLVGCVVLDKAGTLVAKGYHHKYGSNHAERDALLKLKNNEAQDGTLFVNLEPCSHYGKTPPCTDLIIEKGIKKVVIAMRDVNPKVDGISKLKAAGIEVVEHVLEDEAKFLNRIFIKNMTQKMPYVVLKTATTLDGKIATQNGDSKWITSNEAREEVYKMRKQFDCILTTSNTVIADNPTMAHKFKCVLDKDSRVSKCFKIFENGKIYQATSKNTKLKNNHLDLSEVFSNLYNQGVCSIFVECGGILAGSLIAENLVDEIYQFIAPKILNDNRGKSCFSGQNLQTKISDSKEFSVYDVKQIGSDILIKLIKKV
ncbi:MAG: bifunctional diaminohydroxyphosphoribosylaminopyrimidine deaminase/5-amino-6-(5-phosphoribosylamino)uracil reductase RibD [bacterium]|nr:bifunctional diaminohydroxyphosphoribosylaminopyrimidine deaminase/5-amino-6-(5-phosphoribosylamino)uracil reductase RibD [bacterium]